MLKFVKPGREKGGRVLVDPTVEENVPAVQGKGRHMPVKGHSVPTGQESQETDADFLANVPAAHAVHHVAPGSGE